MVGVASQLAVVQLGHVVLEIVEADAQRFGADNLGRVGQAVQGVAHCLKCFVVTGDAILFGRFEKRFFVLGVHVRFVLQGDVIRCDAHGFVGLVGSFPPVCEVGVYEGTVGVGG